MPEDLRGLVLQRNSVSLQLTTPQKHLAGRSHSIFVCIAGHLGDLAKNRPYLQAGVSGILANLLKREQRIATVAALIVYRKKNQVLTQSVVPTCARISRCRLSPADGNVELMDADNAGEMLSAPLLR